MSETPLHASERFTKRNKKSKKPLIFSTIIAIAALAATGVFALNKNQKSASSQELNIGLLLEPSNLNIRETSGVALDQILLDNVYQGLITLKSGAVDTFEPVLATELPTMSADALNYTFKLRQGVKFHDGSALDAEDVVTSLSTGLKTVPELATANVSSPSSDTIEIKLHEPNQHLLWNLAGRAGVILDSAATNDLANSANGTGPYTLQQWRQGAQLTLKANPDYWGEKATTATVNFKFIPDPRAGANALKDGSLDIHTAFNPNLRKEFTNNPEFELVRAASTDVFTLAYNNAKAPFNDPEVRQALSQAIDTSAVIASQSGDGKAIGSPITEIEPGFTNLTHVNSYNPEQAKATLAAKGLTGTTMTITAPNFYDSAPLDIVASQLGDVGIDVKVERVEFSTWLQRVYTGRDFDMSYVDHAEPLDFANYANPNYYFGYQNAQVAQLYHQSITATSASVAEQKLAQAAEIVASEAPAKWLYNYTPTLVIRKNVENFPLSNTNSRINLAGVSVK